MGALVTGIIQSSSASVGILQALSATGVITYGSAIPIIMGQNIGTCVTALLSSVVLTKTPPGCHGTPVLQHHRCKHLPVRVLRAQRCLPLCLCEYHHRGWGIAIVHSVFNILATVILLPFATGLEKLAILTIPDSPEKEEFALLDDRLLNTPRRGCGARPRRYRRNGRACPGGRSAGHEPDPRMER